MSVENLFCDVDDFCRQFLPYWHRQQLQYGERNQLEFLNFYLYQYLKKFNQKSRLSKNACFTTTGCLFIMTYRKINRFWIS